jgi:hypothetical protein
MTSYSINATGGIAGGPDYDVSFSAGEPATGEASSAHYDAGTGFWSDPGSGTTACDCPFQDDFDEDGFVTALDLAALIDILFAGAPDVKDSDCPVPRGDDDCDGFTTALDLSIKIDHLFASGPGPCNPCDK